jgi:3D (Asp-Asp-Asp) domain-containing protein
VDRIARIKKSSRNRRWYINLILLLYLILHDRTATLTLCWQFRFQRLINLVGFRAIMQNGQAAQAMILNMWDTGVSINDNPRTGMTIEVRPANGAPFQDEVKQVISRLQTSQYQPGQMLEVKYDPANSKKVVISAIIAGSAGMGGMAQQAPSPAATAQLQATLQQQDALNQQIIATGEAAKATVLGITATGITMNGNNPYVALNLQVIPASRAPFIAQTQAVIAAQSVQRYQPGAVIAVRFDPQDTTRVAIEHS